MPPVRKTRKPSSRKPKAAPRRRELSTVLPVSLDVFRMILLYFECYGCDEMSDFPKTFFGNYLNRPIVRDGDTAKIIKTRRSLLLVSRVVHQEWASIFYGSTFVTVNDHLPVPCTHVPKVTLAVRHPAYVFDNLFLKTTAQFKLRAIKRIMYDATKFLKDDIKTKYIDHDDLKRFGQVLAAHRNDLPSLKEVVLCGDEYADFSAELPTPIVLRDSLNHLIGISDNVGKVTPWMSVQSEVLSSLNSMSENQWLVHKILSPKETRFSVPGRTSLIFRNVGPKPRTTKELIHRHEVLGGKLPKWVAGIEASMGPLCQTCVDDNEMELIGGESGYWRSIRCLPGFSSQK